MNTSLFHTMSSDNQQFFAINSSDEWIFNKGPLKGRTVISAYQEDRDQLTDLLQDIYTDERTTHYTRMSMKQMCKELKIK